MTEEIDCAVIGGGPAGLTAAVYLARFRRSVVVIDRGGSRALQIPLSHNLSGFPEGISGADLIARMSRQARQFGAEVRQGSVIGIVSDGTGWRLTGDGVDLTARAVLFATGVANRRPIGIDDAAHDEAVAAGKLRYCPICDGFEAGGDGAARIGVLGAQSHGVAEALFLRGFSDDVVLLTQRTCELHEKDREDLARAGVRWETAPVETFDFRGQGVRLILAGGSTLDVDTLYPALGSEPHVDLIGQLGLRTDADGCILTDGHQRLGMEGLYAAGDVVSALDQIGVAMGHAAVAATAMHNDLRERDALTPG